MKLEMTVNDKLVSLDVAPNAFLADVLRKELGLTGTKIGCQEAECGICTVLVNGMPVNSCIYPAVKANGAHVETIEGLAATAPATAAGEAERELHPLQQAFIDYGAVQCGFCTPGLIMTAKALLDRNPDPTDDDIKHALKDTYCRCTGYVSVINAIKDAAKSQIPNLKSQISNQTTTNKRAAQRRGATTTQAGRDSKGHGRRKIRRRL
jgi:aerobic-type carbon monoxide dehydrogenase small subunit (CoxS/CutS family)